MRLSKSASVLDVPSSVVMVDAVTFWLVPALATGTEFNLAAVTVKTTTGLSTLPSFTVKPSK